MSKEQDTKQLSLFGIQSESSLRAFLEKKIGKPVSLILTNNSSSMLSARVLKESIAVRLHKMFLCADSAVLGEVAEFIKRRKKNTPLLRDFIKENSAHLIKKPRTKRILTGGRFHDIKKVFDRLNREYFENKIASVIGWGVKNSRSRVKRMTLGSYSSDTNTITINPILDKRGVPDYFIEFIVYHEMLHADIGIKEKNGRRVIHPKEFKTREKMFKAYDKALAWEKRRGV